MQKAAKATAWAGAGARAAYSALAAPDGLRLKLRFTAGTVVNAAAALRRRLESLRPPRREYLPADEVLSFYPLVQRLDHRSLVRAHSGPHAP